MGRGKVLEGWVDCWKLSRPLPDVADAYHTPWATCDSEISEDLPESTYPSRISYGR
jgi:hypothetical protein